MKIILTIIISYFSIAIMAQDQYTLIDEKASAIEEKVIEWRRDFHQFPELSNREFKTAAKIEKHLKKLGLEVTSKVAHTGVVGILKGGKPGPTVALRADMDGLPVVERVDLPFKSVEKTTYLGKDVGIMHACGHDTHVAMLLGAAEILTAMKKDLKGNVVFIFQPAEEGTPEGEGGGAEMMVDQGVLVDNNVDVIFGLHINSLTEVGKIRYKPGGTMAAADQFKIIVKGKQAHGSRPWSGVDPIAVSAQIIMGLQTIISRQTDLTNEAAVITVGKIDGGVRHNIIPETCEMIGTIRTLDKGMQKIIHEKIKKTAELIAESAGAVAEVHIEDGLPVTYNDPKLTAKMLPTIFKSAGGEENVFLSKAVTGAEDFSFYALKVPGLFLFLGGMEKGASPLEVGSHHTPDFRIDESGLKLGVKTLCNLTLDYMNQ